MLRRVLASVIGLTVLAAPVAAQDYPTKPVKLIVAGASGTAPDIIARLLAPELTQQMGQPAIVENVAGANGTLAVQAVGRAAADGYTFLVTTAGAVTANPYLYPKTGALALRDLAPVTTVGTVDFVVATRADLGVGTMEELVTYIRERPDKINVATTAKGSFPHLAAELLKQLADLKYQILLHNGGSVAGATVAGGHADVVIETAGVLEPLQAAGKLKFLASTGNVRQARLPDLKTVAEAGVEDYALSGWVGILAPKNTPIELRDKFRQIVARAARTPDTAAKLKQLHYNTVLGSPAETEASWKNQSAQIEKLVQQTGLTME